jgi:hypothetical protein
MNRIILFRYMKLVGFVLCALIIFYICIYYAARDGDAFKSFIERSKNSSVIKDKFGNVKSVELDFLHGYREKTRGDSGSARFEANIVGSKARGSVVVEMNLKNEVWSIGQVHDDDGVTFP